MPGPKRGTSAGSALLLLPLVWTTACASTEPQTRGFALPPGDPTAGQLAFQELRCTACHQVDEVALPKPVADPPVPLVLGGRRLVVPNDAELVTAIIYPEHRITPMIAEKAGIEGELSRMGDYKPVMTVQQLVDLVSFLKAHYQKALGAAGNLQGPAGR